MVGLMPIDDPYAPSNSSARSERPSPTRHGIRGGVVLLCTLLILGLMSVSGRAASPCTDTFTGASGGNWAASGNWTTDAATHVVPGSSDVVCLGSNTVLVNAGAQTASSIEDGTGSLEITGGSLTLTSTTAGSSIDNFALDDTGSFTAPASQTVSVTGNFEWGQESTDEQEQLLNAVINQTGGGSFAIDGDPTGDGLGGPQLTGSASIHTTSAVSITNGLFGATGAQTLTTTGIITLGEIQLDGLTSEATITASAIAAQPANAGTYGFWDANLVLTGGTTTVATNTTLEAGDVTLVSGTIDAVGDISPPPGYALDAMTINSGTLTGAGDIYANVTNVGGTVAPPGGVVANELTVTGTYTQDSGGTLAIGMDENDTSLLRVFQGASLAGDLSVTDLAGAPSPGQEFDVVTDSSTTGTVTLTGPSAAEYAVSYPTGSAGGAVRLTAATPTTTTTVPTTTTTVPTTTTTTSTSTVVSGSTPTTTSANVPPETTTPPTTTQGTSDSTTAPCPKPSGRLGGLSIGPLALGFTRAQARRTLTQFSVTSSGLDDFCLDGGRDIRAAYPTPRILAGAPKAVRASLRSRVILAVTPNQFYALDGAKPGDRVRTIAKRLHLGAPFRISGNDWYVIPGELANGVLKTHAGVVSEVGLVNRRLSGNRVTQRRVLSAFGTA
jgi:hypothetical protein